MEQNITVQSLTGEVPFEIDTPVGYSKLKIEVSGLNSSTMMVTIR